MEFLCLFRFNFGKKKSEEKNINEKQISPLSGNVARERGVEGRDAEDEGIFNNVLLGGTEKKLNQSKQRGESYGRAASPEWLR